MLIDHLYARTFGGIDGCIPCYESFYLINSAPRSDCLPKLDVETGKHCASRLVIIRVSSTHDQKIITSSIPPPAFQSGIPLSLSN